MLKRIKKGVLMFTKLISAMLIGLPLANTVIAQEMKKPEARQGYCHIIVAKGQEKVERIVNIDPEEISTDLGSIGGFTGSAGYLFDEEKNAAFVSLDIKGEDGIEHNLGGQNYVIWTIFNYKNQYLSVVCGEKTK